MAVSKVTLNNQTLMDVTDATATFDKILDGYTSYVASGEKVTGTASEPVIHITDELDSHGGTIRTISATNISDSTVSADKMLNGTVAYSANGTKLTGTADFFDYTQPVGKVIFNGSNIPALMCRNRTGITEFVGNNVTSFSSLDNQKGHHFYGCTSMASVSLPLIGYSTNVPYTFYGCTSLVSVNLPSLRAHYGGSMFANCIALPGLVLPMLGIGNVSTGAYGTNANFNVSGSWFNGCISFKYFDCLSPYQFKGDNVFKGDTLFDTLIIRGNRVSTLDNINVFTDSPFASGRTGGTLYVPEDLIDDYQAATNWSTILGYPNNQIKKIEGSYYETHYADGTEIPTGGGS